MGKAIHKPRPSVPRYYWWDTDNCYFCKRPIRDRGCSGCKHLKRYNHSKDKAKRHATKQHLCRV